MRINSLIGLLFLCSMLFSSCDDDLRSVGGSIQPKGDDVLLEVDSLDINVRTVLMNDSVYVRNTSGLLGRYYDDTYGSILSEYLTELYCPDTLSFYGDVYKIDSTKMEVMFYTFSGDSLAPMGVSFYQLNNKLEKNNYTNIDVSKYCDLSKPLGNKAYTIDSSPYLNTSSKVKVVKADMGNWGQKLYDASKTDQSPLKNNNTFRDYFPGMYVKSSFGNGSLLDVLETAIVVYYTSKKDTLVRNPVTKLNDKDSVMYTNRTLYLSSTAEIIQLNKVENKVPQNLLDQPDAVYIKTPAGVCAELELPIKEIIEKTSSGEGSKAKTINMARLKLKGYTELEQKNPFDLGRVSTLLLINKDSVQGFFSNPYRVADLSSSLIYATSRDASTNTYVFPNLAPMISEYRKQNLTTNPKFLLVPVTVEMVQSTSVIGYFNSMKPAVSIIRAGEGDVKLEMIYSTF